MPSEQAEQLAPNFVSKFVVSKKTGCWLWQAAHDNSNYGKFSVRGRLWMAHRWSYTVIVGPIPKGLTLDHLCRVHNCVNPDHLEAVTVGENTRRGTGPVAINARKTHCLQGHKFDSKNTYIYNGERQCRKCRKLRAIKYRTR